MIFRLLRAPLFALDPELAHGLTLKALKAMPAAPPPKPGPLSVELAGLTFANPLGMAAGFDKNAEVPDAVLGLGFSHLEVGSITPKPQSGNPRPRLFRLVEDRAVINRMGFNNEGGDKAAGKLASRKQASKGGIVGINIGANKDADDRIADYAHMTRLMAPIADYLTVNISSPNTPGLRALQDEGALNALLDGVIESRGEHSVPIFLKVAPDLQPSDVDAIARIALEKQLAALVVSNTTIERPGLKSHHRAEAGGLSGAPLRPMALERLRDFRRATGAAIPLVGVGGISSGKDTWERIRAGASLVQLYSAMVYEGPGLAKRILREMQALMKSDGFSSIAEAVGSE
ncbi:quinone-dependent dihydroorotate dehydrogenase [Altererythrobacter sp. MF3-039]|uniref:quinone-dependent dihydroorotate dehydrogenase n=1 Tax=Altererythrobacter sp. MF3-039 TaxID=3252901 RepID=UPI00390CA5BB